MRARPAALVAALAALGCKGKDVEVPVTMTLDMASCTTDYPDSVELTCPTAVGVSLWGGESAERLESECIDLPGTDRTLVALPSLLADVDLSTSSADEPVRLEIGLFAPQSAGDGCPDVQDFDAKMLLYGDTEPIDLAAPRGFAVNIVCLDVDVDFYQGCYTDCDDTYNSCFEQTWCQQDYDACVAACTEGDAGCMSACQSDLEACMVDECSALNEDCMAGCSGDAGCDTRCASENTECLEYGACDARYTTCLNDCDTATPTSCASIY